MSNKRQVIYVGPGQWKIVDPATGASHTRFDEDLNMDVADDFITELIRDNKADIYVDENFVQQKYLQNAVEAADEGLAALKEAERLEAKIKSNRRKKKSTMNSSLLMATLAAVLQQRRKRKSYKRTTRARSYKRLAKTYKRYYRKKYRSYYRR